MRLFVENLKHQRWRSLSGANDCNTAPILVFQPPEHIKRKAWSKNPAAHFVPSDNTG
jgi:hypothetical protein